MISRFKWYAVRFPTTIAEAFHKLEHYRYEGGQSSGFVVDPTTSSFEFFWPTPLYATSIDEDGQAMRNEVFSVSRQQVDVVGGERVVFRMKDPPRSSKELFNTLEKLIGFGFVCEHFPVTDALVKQAVVDFHSVVLNSIKFSGGLPAMSALARVELVSKQGLELDSVEGFGLQGRVVESASYSVKYKGLAGQVGFTRTGMCKISGDLAPLIQSKLESCILRSIR